ncbi:alginate export family protein [Parvularcula maris]|uniref:alginate export family protein n=1 Tax=Parvularcula maris TaxID=2965077 RepID=UPI0021155643|nr:alginate export family protein [Parvularcula maris]
MVALLLVAQEPALSFSGQIRERGVFNSAILFDKDSEEAGSFWAQRLALAAHTRSDLPLRAKVSLLSALQEGVSTSPVERNNLDLQEGYVEAGSPNLFVRLGRQEMKLGSQRLVGVREGTNVRRTWDGVRSIWQGEAFEATAFGLWLVQVQSEGVFNDNSNQGELLAGLHTTFEAKFGGADVYYLYNEQSDAQTIEGTDDQKRHSWGGRVYSDGERWHWDLEGVYQGGSHGGLDISAWTFAVQGGRSVRDWMLQPTFELGFSIASGDDRQEDGKLGTFDALYPRGNYFSEAAILGPSNFVSIRPSVSLEPSPRLALSFSVDHHWRLSDQDGLYGPPDFLLRDGLGSDENFVQVGFSAGAEWHPTKRLTGSLLYTYASPKSFIEGTGPSDDLHFVELSLTKNF